MYLVYMMQSFTEPHRLYPDVVRDILMPALSCCLLLPLQPRTGEPQSLTQADPCNKRVYTNIRQDNQRVVQDREDLFARGASGMMFITSCLTSVSKIAIQ
jgi:hypothetical protein